MRHPRSYGLALLDPGGEGSGRGDVALNYRFQALGTEEGSRVAVAPRVSLLFATGDDREGRGSGAMGYQLNLPLSARLGDAFVVHGNAGAHRLPIPQLIALQSTLHSPFAQVPVQPMHGSGGAASPVPPSGAMPASCVWASARVPPSGRRSRSSLHTPSSQVCPFAHVRLRHASERRTIARCVVFGTKRMTRRCAMQPA